MAFPNFLFVIAFLIGMFFGGWAPFWLEVIGFGIAYLIYKTWFSDRELESLLWILILFSFGFGILIGDGIVFFFIEHNSISGAFKTIWDVITYPFKHRL